MKIWAMVLGALVCVDSTYAGSNLLVTQYQFNRVSEYSVNGVFLQEFIAPGAGGLAAPGNLRFGPDGNLYVASLGDGTVKKYDGVTGQYLGDFVSVQGALDLTFDSAGNAFVPSYTSSSVYKFDSAGTLLQTFSGVGPSEGIVWMPNGHLLLTLVAGLGGNSRVVELDPLSGMVSPFATGLADPVGIVRGADERYYVANAGGGVDNLIAVIDANGGVAQGWSHNETAYESDYLSLVDSDLFIATFRNNQVLQFDGNTGDLKFAFDVPGSPTGIVARSCRESVDLNGDGTVDAADAGLLFAAWDTSAREADLLVDGIVDAADAGCLFAAWTGDSATPMRLVPEPMGSVPTVVGAQILLCMMWRKSRVFTVCAAGQMLTDSKRRCSTNRQC